MSGAIWRWFGHLGLVVGLFITIGATDSRGAARQYQTSGQRVGAENSNAPNPGLGAASAAVCDCPNQADLDNDGFLTSNDLSEMLDILYGGATPVQDPQCPTPRADVNADGVIDERDLYLLIDLLFSGASPVDPCTCPGGFPCPGATWQTGGSVVVESKTVLPLEAGVTIPIKISNDVAVRQVTVPLVFREITPGSFITSLAMSYSERLPPGGTLGEDDHRILYADEDGNCKQGSAGGFGTIAFHGGGSHAVAASPEAVLFTRGRQTGANLSAGSDATGSMILTVDVTGTPGAFEIDTTCANPSHHLSYIEGVSPYRGVIPSFTKSIITIQGGLTCASSYTTDPYLLACPLGDNPFEIHLIDDNGDPVVGDCGVTLDFSDCAPGEFIPAPGIYPDWPVVHAPNPSDANGIITFYIAAGGNCPQCSVTVSADCGFTTTIPARSVDVDGDLNVLSGDFDEILGDCRDLTANGVVNTVDFTHHIDHCCGHQAPSGPEEWLIQTITTEPNGGFVPGENVDATWRIYNNSPGGICPGVKISPQTTWVIDSVQMFWSDWSVSPVLNYITTLIRDVPLLSGSFDEATFSHLAPQNDVCYHSHVFSDCCLDPLEYTRCPPLAADQCPPAAICVEFQISGLDQAQDVDSINMIPHHLPAWEWTSDVQTVGSVTKTTICTSELSPAGTEGSFLWRYTIGGVQHYFECKVKQELFMGDMNDFENSGHPNCFVDALDLGYLIDYLFAGGPAPTPALAADIDCDGYPTSVDMAKLIDYLFAGSDPPPYCDRK